MNRVRRTLRCTNCSDIPVLSDERWICQCEYFQWQPERGYEGTAEDRELLERYRWRLASDTEGFVYWIAPGNRAVVCLYANGTWAGGPAEFTRLEDYLDWNAGNKPLNSPSKN
jgi:hypothetical protein